MKKGAKPGAPGKSRGLDWGAGRVAFVAHANDIRTLLDAGHPMTRIYQEMREHLAGLTYEGFRYHVNRLRASNRDRPSERKSLQEIASPPAGKSPPPPAPSPPRVDQAAAQEATYKPIGSTFQFDPKPRDFS